MAHNLVVTLFILAVNVAAVATPFVYATKSPASTIAKEDEATKEGDATAKAPKPPPRATKGSAKDHKEDTKGDAAAKAPEAATKGYAMVPKTDAKGVAAKGSGAPMSWPDGGPKFVQMVIKNPFLKTTPPSSDGLPIDPTPEVDCLLVIAYAFSHKRFPSKSLRTYARKSGPPKRPKKYLEVLDFATSLKFGC
ncbi:unnamed protein product [Miscanthus lutarioriparius]|uniref:Uncharacterized protein n=1 Tax=Miscanthus lutarioriparius TaxID=422564 RepID=A0A811PRJ9_9POAL|nr:unnamed protein product [Miscanthus lutarioriparius]